MISQNEGKRTDWGGVLDLMTTPECGQVVYCKSWNGQNPMVPLCCGLPYSSGDRSFGVTKEGCEPLTNHTTRHLDLLGSTVDTRRRPGVGKGGI